MTDEAMITTPEIEETAPVETEEDTQSEAIRAAYEAGRSDALAETDARITELEKALRQANQAAQRRETEIRCGVFLRERGLDTALSQFILAPQETEVAEETEAALVKNGLVITKRTEQNGWVSLRAKKV